MQRLMFPVIIQHLEHHFWVCMHIRISNIILWNIIFIYLCFYIPELHLTFICLLTPQPTVFVFRCYLFLKNTLKCEKCYAYVSFYCIFTDSCSVFNFPPVLIFFYLKDFPFMFFNYKSFILFFPLTGAKIFHYKIPFYLLQCNFTR